MEEALKHVDRNKSAHDIRGIQPEDIIVANMDAKLIIQVMINLVNNAIKYTQKDSMIRISYGDGGEMIYVSIADNGPGMDENAKEHAFDMFYTGQNMAADGKRSMGLGLALCKSIVNAHGGEITVTDHMPHGSIFTFSVPAGEVELHE